MKQLFLVSNDNGTNFKIPSGKSTIGRGHACDIKITEDSISRNHAILTIKFKKDKFYAYISDSGSRNGTFVNGKVVKTRRIKSGDEICFADGNTFLFFDYDKLESSLKFSSNPHSYVKKLNFSLYDF